MVDLYCNSGSDLNGERKRTGFCVIATWYDKNEVKECDQGRDKAHRLEQKRFGIVPKSRTTEITEIPKAKQQKRKPVLSAIVAEYFVAEFSSKDDSACDTSDF